FGFLSGNVGRGLLLDCELLLDFGQALAEIRVLQGLRLGFRGLSLGGLLQVRALLFQFAREGRSFHAQTNQPHAAADEEQGSRNQKIRRLHGCFELGGDVGGFALSGIGLSFPRLGSILPSALQEVNWRARSMSFFEISGWLIGAGGGLLSTCCQINCSASSRRRAQSSA